MMHRWLIKKTTTETTMRLFRLSFGLMFCYFYLAKTIFFKFDPLWLKSKQNLTTINVKMNKHSLLKICLWYSLNRRLCFFFVYFHLFCVSSLLRLIYFFSLWRFLKCGMGIGYIVQLNAMLTAHTAHIV